jgi:uncharacterized DUF497 family protein
MEITFDPGKNAHNIESRGLSFERVRDFEFEMALFTPDLRRDYGEARIRALGWLDKRMHALVLWKRSWAYAWSVLGRQIT